MRGYDKAAQEHALLDEWLSCIFGWPTAPVPTVRVYTSQGTVNAGAFGAHSGYGYWRNLSPLRFC